MTLVLKNGVSEDRDFVIRTMQSLRFLFEKKRTVFYEMVMKCRDSEYNFSDEYCDELKQFSLIGKDGSVDDRVCGIVLSASGGDDLDMYLGSPVSGNS